MRRKQSVKFPLTNAGITTIITVLLILSLVTFACLTYANAAADKQLSDQLAGHTRQYYDACNQANRKIAQIAQNIEESTGTGNNHDLQNTYSFAIPVDDTHELCVVLALPSDSDNISGTDGQQTAAGMYRITRYEVVTTHSWNGEDNTLPLQTKGNKNDESN